jgi:hypothetical protein
MPDEIDVQMMVLVFGTETGAETGLAALRHGNGPGYVSGVRNSVVLRRDLCGGLQMKDRPDTTSSDVAGSGSLLDAVVELMVEPTGSLMPGTSALITVGHGAAAAEMRSRLTDKRALLTEAVQVNLTARLISLDGGGERHPATTNAEV